MRLNKLNVLLVVVTVCLFNKIEHAHSQIWRPNEPQCRDDEFRCLDNACIDKRNICDGRLDCWDDSDESPIFCANRECQQDLFRCDNGRCVHHFFVCDGHSHCEDKSDEEPSICFKYPCPENDSFRCKNTGACIPRIYKCDGIDDCDDKSDERECSNQKIRLRFIAS